MQLTEEQEFTMQAARKGYESYSRSSWEISDWDSLPSKKKNAWFSAADRIINFFAKQRLVHNQ